MIGCRTGKERPWGKGPGQGSVGLCSTMLGGGRLCRSLI